MQVSGFGRKCPKELRNTEMIKTGLVGGGGGAVGIGGGVRGGGERLEGRVRGEGIEEDGNFGPSRTYC